jgi:SAM-dependent methyltransferase
VTFNTDFLRRYLKLAPAALALERSIECEVHARNLWQSPILDIGCGDGIFAKVLFAERVDTGIDLESAEVERARRHGIYRELIVCPGHRIPKPDGSYRTIFSNSVLEHIPDLSPVLKEANRLLAQEGRFYITVPTDRLEQATLPARLLSSVGFTRLAGRYGKFYNRFWRHYHAYDEPRWRELFNAADFEIAEESAYVSRNLSTFYDLLTVLAIPSLVSKKLVNRWIVWPRLRRTTAGLTHAAISPIIKRLRQGDGGCLVFYALKKRQNAG